MKAILFPTLALITRDGVLEDVLVHGNIQVTSVCYGDGLEGDRPILIHDAAAGGGQRAVVKPDIQTVNADQVALFAAVLPPLGRPVFHDLTEKVQAFVIIKDGLVQNVITDELIGVIDVNRAPKDVPKQDQTQLSVLMTRSFPAIHPCCPSPRKAWATDCCNLSYSRERTPTPGRVSEPSQEKF